MMVIELVYLEPFFGKTNEKHDSTMMTTLFKTFLSYLWIKFLSNYNINSFKNNNDLIKDFNKIIKGFFYLVKILDNLKLGRTFFKKVLWGHAYDMPKK